jgi:long-chain acyl-CoA synthetase
MIIAGGYNIYPREIEEVLYEHPAIQECVTVGVPDPYRGETVKAYIVLKEDQQVTEEELNAFCREHLASFKVPRIYEFRKELPKTAIGKILRRTLVEEEKEKHKEASATT